MKSWMGRGQHGPFCPSKIRPQGTFCSLLSAFGRQKRARRRWKKGRGYPLPFFGLKGYQDSILLNSSM